MKEICLWWQGYVTTAQTRLVFCVISRHRFNDMIPIADYIYSQAFSQNSSSDIIYADDDGLTVPPPSSFATANQRRFPSTINDTGCRVAIGGMRFTLSGSLCWWGVSAKFCWRRRAGCRYRFIGLHPGPSGVARMASGGQAGTVSAQLSFRSAATLRQFPWTPVMAAIIAPLWQRQRLFPGLCFLDRWRSWCWRSKLASLLGTAIE